LRQALPKRVRVAAQRQKKRTRKQGVSMVQQGRGTRARGNGPGVKGGDTVGSRRAHRRFLLTASVGAIAALLPQTAHGQAMPAGCAPPVATNGTIVNCLLDRPAAVDPIVGNVDDLTIVVGSPDTPTDVVNGAGDGVALTGAGQQQVDVAL